MQAKNCYITPLKLLTRKRSFCCLLIVHLPVKGGLPLPCIRNIYRMIMRAVGCLVFVAHVVRHWVVLCPGLVTKQALGSIFSNYSLLHHLITPNVSLFVLCFALTLIDCVSSQSDMCLLMHTCFHCGRDGGMERGG